MCWLATHEWGCSEELEFATVTLNNLTSQLKVALEKSCVNISALDDEWVNMVDYGQTCLNIAKDKSLAIWWKLLMLLYHLRTGQMFWIQ